MISLNEIKLLLLFADVAAAVLVEHESDNIRDEFRRNELIVCRTRNNHRFSVYWSGWIGRVFKVKIYD